MSISRGPQPDPQIKKERLLSGYNTKHVFKKVAEKVFFKPLELAFIISIIITASGELFDQNLSAKWYVVVYVLLFIIIIKESLIIVTEIFFTPDNRSLPVGDQGEKKSEK